MNAAEIAATVIVAWIAVVCILVAFMHGARLGDDNLVDIGNAPRMDEEQADPEWPEDIPTDVDEPVPYWPISDDDLHLVHDALVASPEFRTAMQDALDPLPVGMVDRCRTVVMDEVAYLQSLDGVC